jgi:hypothetical protein
LALIALLVWWFTPHYTADEEAYYRAVFCMIDHDDSRQFLHDMQNIVEGEILTTHCIKPITCRRWGSGCWTPGASSARRNKRWAGPAALWRDIARKTAGKIILMGAKSQYIFSVE